MSSAAPARSSLALNLTIAVACAILGATGTWLWQTYRDEDPAARLGTAERAAIEQVVHDYLISHPEVLPKAMAELERKQSATQLASVRTQVERATAGTVLGNPNGKCCNSAAAQESEKQHQPVHSFHSFGIGGMKQQSNAAKTNGAEYQKYHKRDLSSCCIDPCSEWDP